MPIIHVRGDLVESRNRIIAHGCNCFNTMGAGVAKAIRSKHPEAYYADCETIRGASAKLGTYSLAEVPGRTIYNLYTQYGYGRDYAHLDYNALSQALTAMKKHVGESPESIGLPRIGCGLAGGDWEIVGPIISRIFFDRKIYVYTL